MEKRLFAAIFLSLLVMLIWSVIFPQPKVPLSPSEVTSNLAVPQATTPETVKITSPTEKLQNLSTVTLDTPKLRLVFSEPIAAVRDVEFKDYSGDLRLLSGLADLEEGLVFKVSQISGNQATFIAENKEKRIIKEFVVNGYEVELKITRFNLSNLEASYSNTLNLGQMNFSGNSPDLRFQDAAYKKAGGVHFFDPRKDATFDGIRYAALRNKYFVLMLDPGSEFVGLSQKINQHEGSFSVICSKGSILPKASVVSTYRIYLGPLDLRIIKGINLSWGWVVNFGTFDLISHGLQQLLELFYKGLRSWGWAIIILSVAVFIVLYPFSIKQMRSMKEMQVLQPKVEALRKAYKDNPQKLNKEIMELYREHKVNPLGGCLPLLLQMPVFFALYQVMMRSVALKGADFLWIKDLSEPDKMPLPSGVLGGHINILPIAMAVLMFFQQKASMSSVAASSEAAQQQKMMMVIMPILFGFIFYQMPSGLVLYWSVNSVLMFIQQLKVSKA